MLPIPTKDYLPRNLRDLYDNNPEAIALCDKMDDLFTEWKDETIEISYCKDPVRTPFQFLDEMDQYLEADFLAGDSELIKRQKLFEAIPFHKTRSTWTANVKKICDSYTGQGAFLINPTFLGFDDDFVLVGTNDAYLTSPYYTIIVGDSGLEMFAAPFIASGEEWQNAGTVWIDLGYNIDEIFSLTDIIPGDETLPSFYESKMSSIGYHVSGYGIDITNGEYLSSYTSVVDNLINVLKAYIPAYMRVFIVYTLGSDSRIYREVI
jgi:hypothetical protein